MTNQYGSDDVAFVLVNGYDLMSYLTNLSDDTEITTEENHRLGDTWVKQGETGIHNSALEMAGFYDDGLDAENTINEAVSGQQGTSRIVNFGYAQNVIGRDMVGLLGGYQANYGRMTERAAFHKAAIKFKGSGKKYEGKILHAWGARTADGDTTATSVDNAASSANGGEGFFQITALTLGTATGLVVKIRHSVDNVTYADLITFAAVTVAPGAEAKAVAGTVNRYLASSWDFTGVPNGATTGTFMAGFARN